MYVSPTVVGDALYIGSCSGIYYALDRSTGEILWSFDTGEGGTTASFHGDPVITGSLVITGSDHTLGGHVYAFDAATGEVVWQRDVGGLETDLVASGPHVIGGTSDGGLVALDARTGEVAWTFGSESLRKRRAWALAPVVDEDRIFYGGRDGKVYALSAATGEEIWVEELGGFVSTATRLIDSQLYVGTYSNELIRLDPDSGEITARLSTEQFPHHALVPAETPAGTCLIVLLGEPEVACVDTDLQKIRWSRSTDDEWTSYNPLVIGDVVLVGSASGELLAIRLKDGTTAWSTELDGMLRGLGVSHGTLYVGTFAGTVYALELARKNGDTQHIPQRATEKGTHNILRNGARVRWAASARKYCCVSPFSPSSALLRTPRTSSAPTPAWASRAPRQRCVQRGTSHRSRQARSPDWHPGRRPVR